MLAAALDASMVGEDGTSIERLRKIHHSMD
jgi:hypothetical protein